VLFLGMGSSRYAASATAARLRVSGIDAAAEYASAAASYPSGERTLVVAISATGSSRETLDAAARYAGRSPLVAVTNDPSAPLAKLADHVVDLRAGAEHGGVACRTF
jgi:glutamine---fructose-6-phosphate transaminase (isomerizing)